MESNPPILMNNVSFISNKKTILNNLNMTIKQNERVLLLGPNGSGKSTLLKACSGLLMTTGEMTIFGFAPHSLKAKRVRSFVSQHIDFPIKLTIGEIIHFVQQHYAMRIPLDQFAATYELNLKQHASQLSGGQQRRLALALALLPNPKLLLLDEPESGLDIQIRESILKEMIMNTTQHHIAIVMATHFFATAMQYFDRVIILREGKIICDHPMKTFLQFKERLQRWDIQTDNPEQIINSPPPHACRFVRAGQRQLRLYHDATQGVYDMQQWQRSGATLYPQAVTAEDIYLYHVGG